MPFALQVVDLVLVVTGDRQPEIDAVPATLQLAQQSGKPVAVVLNRLHPFTDPTAIAQALQSLDIVVSPIVIRERSAHYKAWSEGKTAAEYQLDGDAAREIQ